MLTHLECTRCGEHYPADRPQTVCPKDAGILYARYDLANIKRTFSSARLVGRTPTMWRYDAVLPDANPVTLGEGFTPILLSREFPSVYIKDEGLNPTGSFKARGLSAAVTMARHFAPKFGLKKLAIPSAGNAASALAAYCAAAGLEAHIFMPKDVPAANRIECDYYGAHVTLVDGLISDCAKKVAELKASDSWEKDGWFDVSTTKEPYRVEGKKTMGYEVAEQLGWKLRKELFIPPAAESACSACGKPSKKWKPSAGLDQNARK
jgi:threonine synthase